MQSWRDTLSVAAVADIDRMLDTCLRLARERLLTASEFEPFAVVTALDGRLLAVDLDTTALGKHPETDELADATAARLRTLAEEVRGTALTLNTRLSRERTDAIEVRIEHREGVAVIVLMTYRRPRFGGLIEYDEPRAFPGEREVWPAI